MKIVRLTKKMPAIPAIILVKGGRLMMWEKCPIVDYVLVIQNRVRCGWRQCLN